MGTDMRFCKPSGTGGKFCTCEICEKIFYTEM